MAEPPTAAATARKIIHIDADSFYASVEMRDNPALRSLPLAVGGRADRRGVIATCNYRAREFGVRSAMASRQALQLCPGLVIIHPRFERYREVSRQFHAIFRDYTEVIEPLSLDEAYLDVTGTSRCQGSATLVAEEIRARIRDELSLTVSAGVAPNKFLAKVASDWRKPDGCFTVAPAQVADFVRALPVARINGVGAVTAGKLQGLGVTTCGDLQQVPLETLVLRFGKYGARLARLAHGEDERAVQTERQRKSISVENTYDSDLATPEEAVAALGSLLETLEERFHRIEERYYPLKRFVKVKFNNFSQTTMEEIIPDNGEHWLQETAYEALLRSAWQRGARPARLLGAGLRLEPRHSEQALQMSLFRE